MSSFVPSYPNQLSALMTETLVNRMSAKSDWMIIPVDGLTRLFSWFECLLWVLFTGEFKALSAMSLRRPTVAFLLKPFLRCRSDVRPWHFFSSPLCGVAKMPYCGIISLFLFVHLSRRRFRHPIGPYLCFVEFQADYRCFPFYLLVMPVLFIVH